jgi:hypothetical protein
VPLTLLWFIIKNAKQTAEFYVLCRTRLVLKPICWVPWLSKDICWQLVSLYSQLATSFLAHKVYSYCILWFKSEPGPNGVIHFALCLSYFPAWLYTMYSLYFFQHKITGNQVMDANIFENRPRGSYCDWRKQLPDCFLPLVLMVLHTTVEAV